MNYGILTPAYPLKNWLTALGERQQRIFSKTKESQLEAIIKVARIPLPFLRPIYQIGDGRNITFVAAVETLRRQKFLLCRQDHITTPELKTHHILLTIHTT